MSGDHFYLFTALASFSKAVQKRLQTVHSPAEIVNIAADYGYRITVSQLSLFAPRLNDEHWVWSGRSIAWQRSFFAAVEAGEAGLSAWSEADQAAAIQQRA